MRTSVSITAAILVTIILSASARAEALDDDYVQRGVLVVSSHHSYAAALRAAKAFSQASGIAYDSRGMIFDDERGLIWPDDDEDELWAGQYAPRRYDQCRDDTCVSMH